MHLHNKSIYIMKEVIIIFYGNISLLESWKALYKKNPFLAIYYFTGISYSGQFWKFLQYKLHYLEFYHWFHHICMNTKPKILFSTSCFFYFQIFQSFRITSVDILLTNKPRSFLKTAMFETGVSDQHKLILSFFGW